MGMSEVGPASVVPLPHGAAIPAVGLGTWNLRGRTGYKAVRSALATGYRHLDTATTYGNEREVGRALRDSGVPREQVFLTTKLPPDRAGREWETIEASLHALDTDYVDLWLVHWPPGGHSGVGTWREFLAIRERGLARAVGVSNYHPRQLDELAEATGELPAVNQIPWSPAEHDPRLLAEHQDRGVVVVGYSPLKHTKLEQPTLREIASRHRVTAAQVVLRWHLQHDILVIPKSAHPERIKSNFDLFGFDLTAAELDRIDRLGTG